MSEVSSKLSEEQIFEFLKTLNVPVRMSDIKVPTKEFIIRIFEYFLRDMQVEINELKSWETISHMEDFAIYEEPTILISLAMIVNHITSPIELNITLKDIVDPKPKRTKKILNYLLVFWNYYLRRCARYHAIRDSYEEEVKKADDLILESQSLDEKYNEMINKLDHLQPRKAELTDICIVKQERDTKLEKECKDLAAEYEDLKIKQTKLHEEINSLQVDITSAKNVIGELEQHILSSPSRINSELQNLTDKIRAEDQKIKDSEDKFKEIEKRKQNIEDILQEDEKGLKLLNELLELVNSIREKVKETVIFHKTLSEEEEKQRRLQMDIQHKEESKLQQDQMSAKLALNKKKHIESAREMLKIYAEKEASLEQAIENLKTKEKNLLKSIDTTSDSIVETIEKMKEADSESKKRIALYVSNMESIKNSFQSSCEAIQIAIKNKFQHHP